MESLNLKQSVTGPTHKDGHTLDFLITHDSVSSLKDIDILDCSFSDHKCLSFSTSIVKQKRKAKKVKYRNTKKFDIESFKDKISKSNLVSDIEQCDTVEKKVEMFNSTLKSLLDTMAPIKTKTITIRPNGHWYTAEVRRHKRARRSAERRWKKTNSNHHHAIYAAAKLETNKAIVRAKKQYVKNKIFANKGNSKELYKILNEIFKPPAGRVLPEDKTLNLLCNDFTFYFSNKVEHLRRGLGPQEGAKDNSFQEAIQHTASFHKFSQVTTGELESVIQKMPTKTCALDSVPTWVIKTCQKELLPALLNIVNSSISRGVFPDSLKQAYVMPLIKKPSLDRNDMNNYRPISNLPFISKLI